MTILVRPAAMADVPRLVELWKEMWDLHTRLDPRWESTPLAEQVMQKWFEENIRGERCLVLAAEKDGRGLVGYVLGMILENPPVVPNQFFGYVSEIAVAEGARGSGIGKRLLEEAEAWFRVKGAPLVEVNVSALNPGAVGFWKREGYEDYVVRLRKEF